MRRLLLSVLIAAAGALAAASSSGAADCTVTWDGEGLTDSWHTPANWSGNAVPGTTAHVCIPAGNSVVVSQSAEVASLSSLGELTLSAGTLALTSEPDVSSLATFTMTGGTLTGGGRLTITGTFTWSGGTMSGLGTTAILPGASATHDDYVYLAEGRRLEVGGTLNFLADRDIWRSGTTGLVHVLPGGLLRKSGGTGVAELEVFLENDGVVDSTSGTLNGAFGSGAETSTGDFGTHGQAGTVQFTGGTFALASGVDLRGGVRLAGGTVEVPAEQTVTTSGVGNEMTGGTLSGQGTFAIGGTFLWSGGTMSGLGTTRIQAGGTVTHDDYSYLAEGRRLEVQGTLNFSADRDIWRSGVTGLVHVAPGGVLRKTGGVGVAEIEVHLENDGLVDSLSGTLNAAFGGGAEPSGGDFGTDGQAGAFQFTGGTLTLADGAEVRGGVRFVGGRVDIPSGTAVVSGAGNAMTGGTIGGEGTLELGGSFLWSGGTMSGAGTTRIPAGATVSHDDYAYLAEGRRLEVAGMLSFLADRDIWRSGVTGLVRVAPGGVLRKTGGVGIADIEVHLENDGLMDATSGTFNAAFGGGAEASNGDFGTNGQGGKVRLTGGAFALGEGAELRGGAEFAGATVEIASGTVAATGTGNAMTAGRVTGAGTLQLGGAFLWSGGTMSGTGTTTIPAGATVVHDDYAYLENGRTLNVAGTLDLIADRGIYRTGPAEPAVEVAAGGTIRKTAGAGRGWVDVALRNAGTVESTSGVLALTRGAAEASTGVLKGASETALVVLDAGTHLLGAGSDLAGWVEVDGATVQVAEGVAVAADDHLVLSAGTIGGAGTLTVTGELRWHGGRQAGPGTTEVPAGGTVVVDQCGGDLTDGRTIDNNGVLRLLKGASLDTYSSSRPTILNAGRIELDDGAAGTCLGDPGIYGNALVVNTGTIEKLGGSGSGYVDATLDNDGTVLASAGELRLSSTTAVTHNGSFQSTGAGKLTLDQGTFILGPGATATGSLLLRANLEPAAQLTLSAGSLLRVQDGGTLQGAGDITVAGALEFVDGRLEGTGALIVQAGATALMGGVNDYVSIDDDRRVINRGTMTLPGGTVALSQGASVLNTGTLAITGAAELYGYGYGFGMNSVVHNGGTILKSGAGDAEISAGLDNDGTVEVGGGSLHLGAPLNYSAAGDALTGGDYVVRSGAILRLPGPVRALGARLLLDGAASSVTWAEYSGAPVQDALGLLERVTAAGSLELAGGRDLGTGPLVNGGAVRLGAGSELTSTGAYRQTGGLTQLGGDGARVAAGDGAVLLQGGRLAGRGAAAPALDLDDGATAHVRLAPGGADQIAVPGEARLDGTLVVETDPGFSPAAGSEISVVTYGSRTGEFDRVEGLSPRPGLTYTVDYRAGGVVLVVGGGRAQAPQAAPEATAAPVASSAPAVALGPLRIDDRTLLRRGSWTRIQRRGRTLSVAAARGASLRARDVRGRSLALVAETCRRCGRVRAYWRGRLLRRVSLRGSRRALRRIELGVLRGGSGTVELRASGRVVVDALLVRR